MADSDYKDVVNTTNMHSEKAVETAQIATLTDEEKEIEKKLVKRIDWIILPIIVTVYLLNWIDRYETLFAFTPIRSS